MKGQVILLFVLIGYVCCESRLSDVVYKSVQYLNSEPYGEYIQKFSSETTRPNATNKKIKREVDEDAVVRFSFNMADSNKNGFVTADEMISLMKAFGQSDDKAADDVRAGIIAVGGSQGVTFAQFKLFYEIGKGQ